ncbi:protein translocase subunit SecF [Tessaracoccus sp. OH4464_COT-324]|uniref:protein translocase subunit SecF n=1 Tax=Tessaracoccus sp. OH4464_COT-324 TaxID=2491059 RepID=UPI000F64447C|nr:protein translocase subunit SecF [Tessaracoccus sp. OH4464_COT-324]RRD47938.1 protein translocase subunit SecF [Tessaracoccus sp. OH4464_COT-324]
MAEAKGSIAHRLYTGQLSYDFMGNRKKWFLITGAVMVLAALVLAFKQLTLGIEFRGGTDFQVPTAVQASTVEQVRRAAEQSFEVKELDAQVFSIGDNAIRVQTRSLNSAEVAQTRADIAEAVGAKPDDVTYNTIGGSWGQKISRDAALAVGVFLVLVMAMIALYFRDWRMAVAAIVALGHDMLITLGVYALVGFTVTPSTLIGLLTILAYSLYDTVVVFDKTKENTRGLTDTKKTYSQQANLAINQVLVRSINTTVIGVLPVLAMFLAGVIGQSNPLKDLGLALLVGMVAGAFSSIFIATPLLAWLKERTSAMVEHRKHIERRMKRATADSARGSSEPVTVAASTAAEEPVRFERQQRRTHTTRAQRKGKK